jgi:DedD protein
MNDHNLDDLIIDTNTAKNSKARGFLTIIALLIVVLIVAIVLTKIILKDPSAKHTELAENNTEMISPELTLQESVEEKSESETELSEMIEDEMKAPEAEEVVKETVTINETKHTAVPPKTSKPAAKPKEEIVKPPVKTASKPTPVTPKTTSPAKPAVKKPSKPTASSNGIFYIQVGSFSKTPDANSRLISAIRKNGYHYKIITVPNGMKKVLIGPYKSRPQVDKVINRVKDRINKSAFVVKK